MDGSTRLRVTSLSFDHDLRPSFHSRPHEYGSKDDNNEHPRVDDGDDYHDRGRPKEALDRDHRHNRHDQVKSDQILREARDDAADRVRVEEENFGAEDTLHHHVVQVGCTLKDDVENGQRAHDREEEVGCEKHAKYNWVLLLLLLLQVLVKPLSEPQRWQELGNRGERAHNDTQD